MRPIFLAIIAFVITLFAGINYYIGLRSWQTLVVQFPLLPRSVYWTLFWILALSFLAGRFGGQIWPPLGAWLSHVGSYWLAAMFYLTLAWLLVDTVAWVARRLVPAWAAAPWPQPVVGWAILGLVIALIIYGTWNARSTKVVPYQITIPKAAGSLGRLNLVMVSDVHLGGVVDRERLATMVAQINRLQPDIVVIVGDLIDGDIGPYLEQEMGPVLSGIKSRFGTYAVLGNHEFIGGHAERITTELESAGVTVLRNQTIKVANSFYLAGRDDTAGERAGEQKRPGLPAVLEGVDRSLPIILLDHQPRFLADAVREGVDLQLAGHTHRGQLFPSHLITERMFEVDWGYLRKGNLHAIVSSGYGTWGPPIRVGSRSEIVQITIDLRQ